ncbi:MAG: TonB-dependent receptor plug domain-containing protein [Bacteroidales bacterium]|nr:TonB-dependent receptor plug domain-containing protein [Bacteroidales bacterium]
MKNKKNMYFLGRFALVLFLMQGICFQNFAKPLDSINFADSIAVHDLEGVTISATGRPRISPNIGQLQALNLSSLERLNALQLSDAVKFFAGANVRDYGGIGGLKTVSVRSLGASHTGVFVDRIPMRNAMNGQIDLGKFSLNTIGEIQLSSDNFSQTLQTASFFSKSSQLSLITASPTFDENQNTQVDVSLRVGSFGLFNPQFNIHQRFGNQLFSLNADYQRASGNYPFELINGQIRTIETRTNSAVESYRVDLMWRNLSNSRHQYFVKANFFDNHRQLPGPVIFYNPTSNQEMWDREKALQAQYNFWFRDSTELLFNAKVSETFNRYVDHNFLAAQQPLDLRFTQTEWFGSAAVQRRMFGFLQTSLSTDIIRHNMRSNLPRFSYPTRVTSLTNWGTSLSWRSFVFYKNLLYTATFEGAESDDVANNRSRLTSMFGVNYRNPNFSARFFYRETYRIPTFNELYYTSVGNTGLIPESARQFNLGFSVGNSLQERAYFVVSVDGYLNRVRDKIVAIPTTNLFTWSMRNIGKVDILGVDAVLKSGVDVNQRLDFFSKISYTFQDARDVSNPRSATYNQQIAYTPRHSGSVVFGVNSFLTLQYSLLFAGERYRVAVNTPNNRLEPYFDHNISLSRNFSTRRTDWRVVFEVLNFTNKNYEIVAFYPMPGRHYRLTVRARLAPARMDASDRANRATTRRSNT